MRSDVYDDKYNGVIDIQSKTWKITKSWPCKVGDIFCELFAVPHKIK